MPSDIVWFDEETQFWLLNTGTEAAWATIVGTFLSQANAAGLPVWGLGVQNEPDATESPYGVYVPPGYYGPFIAPAGPVATAIAASPTPNAKMIVGDMAVASHSASYITQIQASNVYRFAVHAEFTPSGGPTPPVLGHSLWQTEMGGMDPFYSTASQQMTQALARAGDYHYQLATAGISLVSEWTPWCAASYAAAMPSWSGSGLAAPDAPHAMQKKGLAFAHYSRFIRPGATRVDCTGAPSGVLASAYHLARGQIVVVAINSNASDTAVDLSGLGSSAKAGVWVTNETLDMERVSDLTLTSGATSYLLPARSVVTLLTPTVTVDTPPLPSGGRSPAPWLPAPPSPSR
jgi:glucuronoarabinoxylan endo-1,4-beta-xylanase